MPIVYLGDEERVSKELAEVRDVLDAQYRKVLGQERARRLEDATVRIVTPRSFYSDPKKIYRDTGNRISGPNKFMVGTDGLFEIDESGCIKDRKIRTAPLFYISEDGFQNSGSATFTERRVVSYVHEFNHYVWYALQKVPYLVTGLGILENLNPVGQETGDFKKLLQELLEQDAPRDEFLAKFSLMNYFFISQDTHEKANLVYSLAIQYDSSSAS